MTISQDDRCHKLNLLYLILVLTAMQLFITLFTNGFALSADEAMWHYIGRNWFRNGLVPYTGGVDNKSPLFFAIFGLSDKLFGINYWFPRVFAAVCQSIGFYYVYKIARHFEGHRAGTLAVSFYGLSVLWHGSDGKYVSCTETYDVLFIIMAFYFLLVAGGGKGRRGSFISGFLAAVGLAFRLSAIFGIAALFIASLRKEKYGAPVFCLGVLSGLVCLALIAFIAGIDLHDVYLYALADNFGSGSTTDHGLIWRMMQFCNMFFYSEIILFYPLILFYLFMKKKVDWLVLWMIFVFIGINVVGNYARIDLKDILPGISIIAAFTVSHFINTYNISMRQVTVIVWICFSPKLLEPFVNAGKIFSYKPADPAEYCHEPYILPDEAADKALGQWVKSNTTPGEKVFVAGWGAQVQAYSERLSPSIYFNATQTPVAKERFYRDIKQNKAGMILVPLFAEYKMYIDADLRAYVDSMVTKDYNFDKCMFNYNVYRVKK